MRECSRNRPTIDRTRMRSVSPFTPGRSDRHPAHDQVDLHAGLRRLIERLDHRRLQQRIHLGDDARRPSRLRMLRLAPNQTQETLRHGQRSHQQRAVVIDLRLRRQVVEDHLHALGDLRIAVSRLMSV